MKWSMHLPGLTFSKARMLGWKDKSILLRNNPKKRLVLPLLTAGAFLLVWISLLEMQKTQ